MSVMKEWECPEHGYFASTHPLCPEIGCTADCPRVFVTPVTVSDGVLKRFDASTKKSVDMMGLGDLRTARAGEAAYGNGGAGVLWGDECQRVLGVDMAGLRASAAKPLNVTFADGRKETIEKSVMRELGREGITQRVLPKPAETTGSIQDRALDVELARRKALK
ncbi:MAG: hypothetical protein HRJ53_09475 [Acidobacteria bacterium Pan2503]|uniref:Uncharacterized protein n=1 Tax=Candidatus Acidiferrum panamense TaxID=2741543 RepID=A0A7V8SWE4_9BACT|nr:hypothetical protein [Candidatus Acidoferrum panamensis]